MHLPGAVPWTAALFPVVRRLLLLPFRRVRGGAREYAQGAADPASDSRREGLDTGAAWGLVLVHRRGVHRRQVRRRHGVHPLLREVVVLQGQLREVVVAEQGLSELDGSLLADAIRVETKRPEGLVGALAEHLREGRGARVEDVVGAGVNVRHGAVVAKAPGDGARALHADAVKEK